MRTGSKSGWITPLLGDAFFTSAMRPGLPAAMMQMNTTVTFKLYSMHPACDAAGPPAVMFRSPKHKAASAGLLQTTGTCECLPGWVRSSMCTTIKRGRNASAGECSAGRTCFLRFLQNGCFEIPGRTSLLGCHLQHGIAGGKYHIKQAVS